jgi:light-regulated signal transduction histidine kinase (bacteriophytochrome)
MNKLLQRQFQKHVFATGEVPENYIKLLDVISESYDHYEKDRRMMDRCMALSSQEMITLNMELTIRNKQLEQKNKELEQFSYAVSHDLQEPLRTISDYVELLKKHLPGKLDGKTDKSLAYIAQSSERMKIFVNDLLQYSRIGNEKTNELVDCNDILLIVLADLGKIVRETHAEIHAGPLPVIIGRSSEIKQLFQNLIVNAIKFSKNSSVPKIKISGQKKKSEWEFSFTDNGIGIEEEHKERIFIIFQRLHSRSEYKGSGIGLSNCKKIVELHHGRIWVESKMGEGSTFHFTIQANDFSN